MVKQQAHIKKKHIWNEVGLKDIGFPFMPYKNNIGIVNIGTCLDIDSQDDARRGRGIQSDSEEMSPTYPLMPVLPVREVDRNPVGVYFTNLLSAFRRPFGFQVNTPFSRSDTSLV